MRVALGVTGGVAAYKAAELLRLLQARGIEVQVVMTRAACEFVTPLTFAALSGRPVITSLFGPASAAGEPHSGDSAIEHIAVAQSVEALVIAPATAHVIAKLAHGEADDFLSTLYLATRAPVILAPAMNVNMWEHAATRENIAKLRERGVVIIEPEAGYLACGMTGGGRLAAVETIAQAVFAALGIRDDLAAETVLVTAGPTHEPLDPVRHISNRSSGKMGYALAEAAQRRGARVLLVSGPVHLDPPDSVECERVGTADQMSEAVLKRLDSSNIVIMAAAVADYQPARFSPEKMKKNGNAITVELRPTRDILAEVASRRRPGQVVVGFAAETEHLIENAAAKLRQKGLDMIVANDVTRAGAGFDGDTNIVTLLFPDGRTEPLEKMAKRDVARRVLDEIVRLRGAARASATHL